MALSDILYNEILRMRDKRIAEEDRVLTAQILVNKVLLGFINDWRSYSTADQIYFNDDAQYIMFIADDKRLEYHVDQFVFVANEISSIGILPDEVSNKLVEFTARMRPMIKWSNIVSHDAWGREYPDSLPNQFDLLFTDILDMFRNINEYCGTV
ncbi:MULTISPECIES: hypothetical protein [Methanosarcina]|uniref:hypothetical protein n=1 Tax=Methanosarcina TaxID=2207 RepID=UPI000B0DC353|nr:MULTISPECIES: hypothetical protein [Methanosarcina]